ncbi:putative oxidoreductase [Actinoplanes missouriensis 431]|uniref:Putative oxidoreductase n=1 Tax=Actinoplanes missouriensis (strain ATCC 14538 / DSM 43046 / CBS 188.64 / JCM 3121 / NBRC 102363 / NCIMB 12654 / NRRL B-3342 / UNCC 431) TaxID=512565 RepID=I0H673_ACTM4|nr:GMC family oxidoreductase [Actinoplanes missouriensis]BAL88510.1 putative oxidoreductase [Actinoplanes missouriensis 431]
MQHADVIVIGTGAGGGTLAHRLASTGKRVLILERGDYLPRERDNWESTAVFVKGKYRAPEFWLDKHGHEFPPEVNYYVGGNTKFYGAALFRLRPQDFGEIRHHGGISPAWPIGYDELEPYYDEAEHLYGVHGLHGEDPTAGRASRPYPFAPVQHEPRIQELSDGLEKLGRHPFHLPIGVNLNENAAGAPVHGSACIRCDRVDGFPCLLDAKSDAQVRCVDPALRHDNVTMITNAYVEKLETSASGREVTAVVAVVNGEPQRFSAGVVVVACGAVNSAALLLRSANDSHPRGLANGSDVVGRHYMRHNNLAVMAVSREPNPTRFQKTLALHDWYFASDDWEFPMGGIQMLGKSDAEQIRANAPRMAGRVSPEMPFEVLAHHAVDFWLCGEDLPDPASRVTLEADGRIRLSLDESNNAEGVKRLRHQLQKMLGDLGMHPHRLLDHSIYLHKGMPIGATAHQAGTVRFGTDPASSALDVNCRAHEVDNLYVVDTSFFPSIGAVNPSLTAMANALRVGDHLASRLG